MKERTSLIKRKTNETDIELDLNIDGTGKCDVKTGMPFFEHMIEQICRHGQNFNLVWTLHFGSCFSLTASC